MHGKFVQERTTRISWWGSVILPKLNLNADFDFTVSERPSEPPIMNVI